ncbi:MAG: type II toxin-antitoxin system RelB/DinJ family antitoxin [Bifidobacteriaceae bacterium]|jgi:DNA-damage-inducible protein J|nr:type II toxin-antitoxin system RelB/DinJ family antitoxin [Bifidobacteriaceae bacterium]
MTLTPVNFRMEADLKERFAQACKDMGMSVSTAFTIFAKRVVRENGIPFPVEADPFYSESNVAALRAAIERAERGEVVTKTVEELEAMAK